MNNIDNEQNNNIKKEENINNEKVEPKSNIFSNPLVIPFEVVKSSFRLLFDTLLHVKITGVEEIPKKGGAILVCNHTDLFDIFMQAAYVDRRISFLAKQEAGDYKKQVENLFSKDNSILNFPQFKWVKPLLKKTLTSFASWLEANYIDWGQTISFEREFHKNLNAKEAIDYYQKLEDKLSDLLSKGALISIFPEGTRSTTGIMSPFKTIAARLAIRNKVPIIPSGLNGCWKFSTIENFISGRMFRNPITFNIGKALNPPDFIFLDENKELEENEKIPLSSLSEKQAVKILNKILEKQVYELSSENYNSINSKGPTRIL